MATKRISELTPKGANISSTDLFEVSIDVGGGTYNTRYITGAEITAGVASSNFANTNLTFTGNRTHDLDGYQLRLNVSGAIGQYIVGNATRNFYVNQTDAGKTGIFVQSTTGYAIDVLSANGTAVRIISNSIGLNCKGNVLGGFFAPSSAGGTGLQAIQDVGDYALKTTGNINCISLPTSAVGLNAGDLWNDSGTIKIV